MPPVDNNQPVQSDNSQPATPVVEPKQSFWSKLFGKKKDTPTPLQPRESLTPPPQLDDAADDFAAPAETTGVDFSASAPTDNLGGGEVESPAAGDVSGGEVPANPTLGGDTAVSGEAGDSDDSSNPPQAL